MRLIKAATRELVYFPSGQIPDYAILSHTWGGDEVLFCDLVEGKGSITAKAGYQKIAYTCEQALSDGLSFAWIDTCCIDKSSSAELSEAINSMFNWYKNAAVCYTYLVDVPSGDDAAEQLICSRWFTRGWTLQELLAPWEVVFFSENWQFLGTRSSLRFKLEQITGIDPSFLSGNTPFERASIAKKMSWAARRKTTRIEDVAYSLLGIFSVNLPLLYGEGDRAFIRLQEQIIQASDDHSIFAWVDSSALPYERHGLLARSPIVFVGCGSVVSFRHTSEQRPFSMTNVGLHITLPLQKISEHRYAASLNCRWNEEAGDPIIIRLYQESALTRQYSRCHINKYSSAQLMDAELQDIYVRQWLPTFRKPNPGYTGLCYLTPLGGPNASIAQVKESGYRWIGALIGHSHLSPSKFLVRPIRYDVGPDWPICHAMIQHRPSKDIILVSLRTNSYGELAFGVVNDFLTTEDERNMLNVADMPWLEAQKHLIQSLKLTVGRSSTYHHLGNVSVWQNHSISFELEVIRGRHTVWLTAKYLGPEQAEESKTDMQAGGTVEPASGPSPMTENA